MSTQEPEGVFGKYVLRKSSGKPLDPEASYFVLRLDTDEAARYAAMEYARRCDNRQLAHDLTACVAELRAPCSCRSVGDECRRHPMFSSVWKAGASPSAGIGEPAKWIALGAAPRAEALTDDQIIEKFAPPYDYERLRRDWLAGNLLYSAADAAGMVRAAITSSEGKPAGPVMDDPAFAQWKKDMP